jgi:hypothetical protein
MRTGSEKFQALFSENKPEMLLPSRLVLCQNSGLSGQSRLAVFWPCFGKDPKDGAFSFSMETKQYLSLGILHLAGSGFNTAAFLYETALNHS